MIILLQTALLPTNNKNHLMALLIMVKELKMEKLFISTGDKCKHAIADT